MSALKQAIKKFLSKSTKEFNDLNINDHAQEKLDLKFKIIDPLTSVLNSIDSNLDIQLTEFQKEAVETAIHYRLVGLSTNKPNSARDIEKTKSQETELTLILDSLKTL